MRTELVIADGWQIEVRGRTRRTSALETEYLLALKQAHKDMRTLPDVKDMTDASLRGWGLAGVAANFRLLAARIQKAESPETIMHEPFSPDHLVAMFDSYLDCEQLPDRSDLWSQVEDAILKLDRREPIKDPNSEGGTASK